MRAFYSNDLFQDGQVTCAYPACPVLNCPEAAQYIREDETCPRCKGEDAVM